MLGVYVLGWVCGCGWVRVGALVSVCVCAGGWVGCVGRACVEGGWGARSKGLGAEGSLAHHPSSTPP